jgi:hypothetical protein
MCSPISRTGFATGLTIPRGLRSREAVKLRRNQILTHLGLPARAHPR